MKTSIIRNCNDGNNHTLISLSAYLRNDMIPAKSFNNELLCPWKWALGIALTVALALALKNNGTYEQLLQPWQQTSATTVLAATLLFLASHLVRAYRIYHFINPEINGTYLGIVKIAAQHQFANNLLPMRLGEAAFPLLLKRHFGGTVIYGLNRLLWLRLLDLICMGTAVMATIATARELAPFQVFIVTVSALVLSATSIAVLSHLFQRLERHTGQATWVNRTIQNFRHTAPTSQTHFWQLFVCTLIAWMCKLAAIVLVIMALSPFDTIQALGGALGSELSSILPIHGIAGAGSFEAAFVAGASFSSNSPFSLSFISLAFNTHLFVLCCTTLMTLITLPISVTSSSQTTKPNEFHHAKS